MPDQLASNLGALPMSNRIRNVVNITMTKNIPSILIKMDVFTRKPSKAFPKLRFGYRRIKFYLRKKIKEAHRHSIVSVIFLNLELSGHQ